MHASSVNLNIRKNHFRFKTKTAANENNCQTACCKSVTVRASILSYQVHLKIGHSKHSVLHVLQKLNILQQLNLSHLIASRPEIHLGKDCTNKYFFYKQEMKCLTSTIWCRLFFWNLVSGIFAPERLWDRIFEINNLLFLSSMLQTVHIFFT